MLVNKTTVSFVHTWLPVSSSSHIRADVRLTPGLGTMSSHGSTHCARTTAGFIPSVLTPKNDVVQEAISLARMATCRVVGTFPIILR